MKDKLNNLPVPEVAVAPNPPVVLALGEENWKFKPPWEVPNWAISNSDSGYGAFQSKYSGSPNTFNFLKLCDGE